jgi:hypothetical protein
MAVAAAASLSISIGAGRWWSIGGVFDLGPFGARQCNDDGCVPANLPLDGGPRWERLAVATGAACLITSLVMLIVASALAAGRTPKLLGKTAIVAVATALVAGAMFVALAPAMASGSLDRGFYLFVVGLVLAGAVGVSVSRSA